MSKQTMSREELNGLIMETLYETGPITGADLMSRTGIGGPEPMKGLVTELINAGYLAQDGKGKDATFGLTDDGVTVCETDLGLGQSEEAAETNEPEVVYEAEFAQAPPAKVAPARVAPARTASKAAPVATKAAPARVASKGQAAPARAASKQAAAPAKVASTKAAPAKVASKATAQTEEADDRILVYDNLDDYTVERLQDEVRVCEDTARALVDEIAGKDGSVDLTHPNAIVASTLLRTVGRYKRRIKNGNKRPARQ